MYYGDKEELLIFKEYRFAFNKKYNIFCCLVCGIGLSSNWPNHFRTQHKSITSKEIQEIKKEILENTKTLEEIQTIGKEPVQGLKVIKGSKCETCSQVFTSMEYCIKHMKVHLQSHDQQPIACFAQEIKYQTFIEVILIFLSYF